MHPSMTKQMADGHIEQLLREADRARMLHAVKKPVERVETTKHRPRFLRRLAASFAATLLFVVALTTVALAYPRNAAESQGRGSGRADSSRIPACLPKQAPEGGICREAGTGHVRSVLPDDVPTTSTSTSSQANDLTPVWITAGSVALLLAAGLGIQARRRVATA